MTGNNPLRYTVLKYSAILFGSSTRFRLEHRIANAVFFIATVALLIGYVILSSFLQPSSTTILYPVVVVVGATLYFFSRFHGYYQACMTISVFFAYVAVWSTYFIKSGISGPAFLGFLLIFQVTIAILPRRQHLFWSAINVASFIALLYIEKTRPQLVQHVYASKADRFIELATTYCISLAFIYFITRMQRDSYARERRLAIDRAASLERQKDMLTEANKGLLQFNNIVSHNLRAPVASIIGMSEVLKTPITEEEKSWAMSYMVDAARMLDTVICDLNAILATNSKPEPEEIEFSKLTGSVLKSLEMQVAEAGAEIRLSIHPDATSIYTIRVYLHSILHNLVSNAVKYRHKGRLPEIAISALVKDKKYCITVQDNGIGIDLKKHSSDLFGLYKRFSHEQEGRGLGLHMTRTQVESLGGSIRVDSAPGAGSVFTVLLPVHR